MHCWSVISCYREKLLPSHLFRKGYKARTTCVFKGKKHTMKATVLRKVRRRCWNKTRKRSKLKNMWTASMVGAPVMVLMLEVTLACRGSEMALIEFVLQLRQLTTCWGL
uniref:Uncharacterized protein n=1 Tax=Aegilops tauschii subsp. strangulata TaxID=200361 RepID=A0A453MTF9_AEGTS